MSDVSPENPADSDEDDGRRRRSRRSSEEDCDSIINRSLAPVTLLTLVVLIVFLSIFGWRMVQFPSNGEVAQSKTTQSKEDVTSGKENTPNGVVALALEVGEIRGLAERNKEDLSTANKNLRDSDTRITANEKRLIALDETEVLEIRQKMETRTAASPDVFGAMSNPPGVGFVAQPPVFSAVVPAPPASPQPEPVTLKKVRRIVSSNTKDQGQRLDGFQSQLDGLERRISLQEVKAKNLLTLQSQVRKNSGEVDQIKGRLTEVETDSERRLRILEQQGSAIQQLLRERPSYQHPQGCACGSCPPINGPPHLIGPQGQSYRQ